MAMKSGVNVPSTDRPNILGAEDPQRTPATDSVIPSGLAMEVRRLSHDLSNALEIIVQCSYLLSTSKEIPEESRAWVTLLEQGVQKSTAINKELRTFIQSHS